MQIYNLNFVALGRAKLRRWQSLFDQVIQRFEEIGAVGEWSDCKARTINRVWPLYAMTVACCAGKVLEELRSRDAVIQNAGRALRLKETLSEHLASTNTSIESVFLHNSGAESEGPIHSSVDSRKY